MRRLTTRGIATAEAIAAREPFTTSGSMLAGDLRWRGAGRLPRNWAETFYGDAPDYVVYSYATPIAWHGARGWTVPPVKYSLTTTRHQGNLYRLDDYGTRDYWRAREAA